MCRCNDQDIPEVWTNTDKVNKIVTQYNTENDFLKDTLDHLNFLHGIQVGVRYKFKSMGIELDYESISGSSSAIGDAVNQDLNMNSNGYSLGLENYFGVWGYGGTISYGTTKFDVNIPGSSEKELLLSEDRWSSKFYILLGIKSRTVGLTLKPYYQIPWGNEINLGNVQDRLITNESLKIPVDQLNTSFDTFGLTIILYNGPQR